VLAAGAATGGAEIAVDTGEDIAVDTGERVVERLTATTECSWTTGATTGMGMGMGMGMGWGLGLGLTTPVKPILPKVRGSSGA
jgi:hypothetical protein